jgi:aryl-alcohol dehydrogenase-like predicted oxidoreductase
MTDRLVGGKEVFPLCLGGNTFSWTSDEEQAFSVLDEYASVGGNFVDTADVYSSWIDGHTGGESEEIIGRWHSARRNRDEIVIATKVGMKPDRTGLSKQTILSAADESLARLRTDRVDLYYAHFDDEQTPLEETLEALDELVRQGKVLEVGASNYTAARLAEALEVSKHEGLVRYTALQPRYNLMDRADYEAELAGLCQSESIACIPYFGLAQGFLTGKYRGTGDDVDSPRAESAQGYLDDRGRAVLSALDEISANHSTTVSCVALAWLATRPTVLAPVASARTRSQLLEWLPFVGLQLSAAELRQLDETSSQSPSITR